jgi:DNA-directed RNA polymerase specialized sigma24 family protein
MKLQARGRVRREPTDEALLVSDDPQAFGLFYARHLAGIERYFARRVGRDAAADLASETFAAALLSRRRFTPGPTPAAGWLYTIAARRLVDHHRRGRVREATLEALTSELGAKEPAAASPTFADEENIGLLRHLTPEQRQSIIAHVIEERDYRHVALQTGSRTRRFASVCHEG